MCTIPSASSTVVLCCHMVEPVHIHSWQCAKRPINVFWRGLNVPRFQEEPLAGVRFDVQDVRIKEVNAVVTFVTVFSNRAALVIEAAHIIFVLANPLLIVFCFADVRGWALRAGNLVHHTLRFPFIGGRSFGP